MSSDSAAAAPSRISASIGSALKEAIPSLMDLPLAKKSVAAPPPPLNAPSSPPPSTTTRMPSLLSAANTFGNTLGLRAATVAQFGDVDERGAVGVRGVESSSTTSAPLLMSGDVDERAASSAASAATTIPTISKPHPPALAPPASSSSSSHQANGSQAAAAPTYETLKQDLVVKMMKAMADNDLGVFAQIPKSTLTELLVKLLDTSSNKATSQHIPYETIGALIATINAAAAAAAAASSSSPSSQPTPTPTTTSVSKTTTSLSHHHHQKSSMFDGDMRRCGLEASDNNNDIASYSSAAFDHDNDNADAEADRDDDDDDLVIDGGEAGEFAYELVAIDVEPSALWSRPPVDAVRQTPFGHSDSNALNNNSDQECDPRIKYYSNRANMNTLADFQLQMHEQNMQQQQLMEKSVVTPSSPNSTATATATTTTSNQSATTATATTAPASSSSIASSSLDVSATLLAPAKQQQQQQQQQPVPLRVGDPRLFARNLALATSSSSSPSTGGNDQSPTRSLSPPLPSQSLLFAHKPAASLLSQLPDFQAPKDSLFVQQQQPQQQQQQRATQSHSAFGSAFTSVQAQSLPSAHTATAPHDTSTVKLSIEDYKRKLQKPGLGQTTSVAANAQQRNSSTSLSNSSNSASVAAINSMVHSNNNSNNSHNNNNNINHNNNSSSSSNSSSNTSSLPSIPSYAVNLQAPQSLHELLRNFQS